MQCGSRRRWSKTKVMPRHPSHFATSTATRRRRRHFNEVSPIPAAEIRFLRRLLCGVWRHARRRVAAVERRSVDDINVATSVNDTSKRLYNKKRLWQTGRRHSALLVKPQTAAMPGGAVGLTTVVYEIALPAVAVAADNETGRSSDSGDLRIIGTSVGPTSQTRAYRRSQVARTEPPPATSDTLRD